MWEAWGAVVTPSVVSESTMLRLFDQIRVESQIASRDPALIAVVSAE